MQEGIANKANDVGISAMKTKLVLKRIMKRKDVEEDKKQDWEDKEQEGEMDKDNEENVNTIEFFIDGDNKQDATADESFDDPMEEDLEDKSNSQDGDKKKKVFGQPSDLFRESWGLPPLLPVEDSDSQTKDADEASMVWRMDNCGMEGELVEEEGKNVEGKEQEVEMKKAQRAMKPRFLTTLKKPTKMR